MKQNTRLVFIIAFATIVALSVVVAAQRSAIQSKPDPKRLLTNATLNEAASQLERDIPKWMTEGDVPGLSVALIRNGEIAWQHAFGVKDSKTKEPVTANT